MKDMKDRDILERIKSSIDEAPIDIFDNIKNQNVVKMLKHDDITRQESKIPYKFIMSIASVAAVFLFVLINFQMLIIPDSYIYLDVNPSIQITTNIRDEVINLLPVNENAADIIKDIEYKGKELKTVTEEIIDSLVDKNYINKEDEIMLLSVYNKNLVKSKTQANELNDTIHNKLDEININPILLTQSIDKSDNVDILAKEYGISVGKMTFIRNMIILNSELKLEELVKLSLSELIALSQSTGIDIDKIIDSNNDERIKNTITLIPFLPIEDDDINDELDDNDHDDNIAEEDKDDEDGIDEVLDNEDEKDELYTTEDKDDLDTEDDKDDINAEEYKDDELVNEDEKEEEDDNFDNEYEDD